MSVLFWVHPALALAMLGSGLWAMRARKSAHSSHPVAGEIYFWLLIATGATGMWLGSRHPGISVFKVATPPTVVLGAMGYLAAKFKPRPIGGAPWLRWHIRGMGASYIGAVTATSFQIFPRLLPRTPLLTVALFALPTLVGGILIRRVVNLWLPVRPAKPGDASISRQRE